MHDRIALWLYVYFQAAQHIAGNKDIAIVADDTDRLCATTALPPLWINERQTCIPRVTTEGRANY